MDTRNIYFNDHQRQTLWAMYKDPDASHEQWAERLGITRAALEKRLSIIKEAVDVRTDTGLLVKLITDGWFEARQDTSLRVLAAADAQPD